MKHLDLFSGIGGFALAGQMVGGIETRQFVEIDPYCQKVLIKNFPEIPVHGDIQTFAARPGAYDIITGGFPCQDISCANPNGRGLEGERSGLFYELMRIVRECRPRYIVLENVAEMLRKHNGRIMGAVLWELSESGFDAEWQVISAASVGAPQLRERVFIVAYPKRGRHDRRWAGETSLHGDQQNTQSERTSRATETQGLREADANTHRIRSQISHASSSEPSNYAFREIAASKGVGCCPNPWTIEPGILRVAHGIPNRVDRVRGCGNALVPQVAAIAFQRVLDLVIAVEPFSVPGGRYAANG